MSTRIYIVSHKQNGIKRLVLAGSQAQAVRHVAASTYEVSVASALDVAHYMKAGITVEDCGEKQTELPIEDDEE